MKKSEKPDETSLLLIKELEKYQAIKAELPAKEMVQIKINSFECRFLPENIDDLLKRLKTDVSRDSSKFVAIYKEVKSRNDSGFRYISREKYCMTPFPY